MNYYNEIDPFCCQWLRNLIAAGLIPEGEVDERDIRDIRPSELTGFTQCHFFAGIGGWANALQLAGWPYDRPVWTGSCPCQPFSQAGGRTGVTDERHLWPAWFYLVEQCKPAVVFGEQVASKVGLGWFDLVSSDLEGAGYAVGAVDLCVASVGATHVRQRLWFVADANSGREEWARTEELKPYAGCQIDELADPMPTGWTEGRAGPGGRQIAGSGGPISFWSSVDWLPCRDGKARPVEPGTFPLAHGVPARVGRLRAYGNAIVPQVAAEFVTAYLTSK